MPLSITAAKFKIAEAHPPYWPVSCYCDVSLL